MKTVACSDIRRDRCVGNASRCDGIRFHQTGRARSTATWSFTTPRFPGYDYPLAVAVVDMEDGIRFVSNVVDCDPDDVEIGMQVEAEIRQMDPEFSMVVFKPVR